MGLDEVIEAQSEIVQEARSVFAAVRGVARQSVTEDTPLGFSVGYIRTRDRSFRLEVRLKGRNPALREYVHEQVIKYKDRIQVESFAGFKLTRRSETKAAGAAKHAERIPPNRPLHLGVSIGHKRGGAGSLGLFVLHDNKAAFLSASHVLAPPGSDGDERLYVYQPGRPDVKGMKSRRRIATVENYDDLSPGEVTSDVALAVLHDGWGFTGNIIPTGHGYPNEGGRLRTTPAEIDQLEVDTRIAKIGRQTGLTIGLLKAVAHSGIEVGGTNGQIYNYSNVVEVEWLSEKERFSDNGDSGAAYFIEETMEPLAIHVGGYWDDDSRVGKSFGCNLATALEDFNVEVMG